MLLIATHLITERIRYTIQLIVGELMGLNYRLTSSAAEFEAWEGPGLFYGNRPPAKGLFLDAHPLLWETEIKPLVLSPGRYREVPLLFPGSHPLSILPFDPLAATFFLVSRMEEYFPHTKDTYGRFPATESVAFRYGFHEIPVVNLWAGLLRRKLTEQWPSLSFSGPAFRYTPTIDIDHAWCYLGRPWWRSAGGAARSILRGEWHDFRNRIFTLAGSMADPYDTYDIIGELHSDDPSLPLFFILNADYGGHDNNVTTSSRRFRALVKSLDRGQRIGIHPSLSSHHHPGRLFNEINDLAEIVGRPIVRSRQHFLKLSMPETYRRLLEAGIRHDYSMGYPSHPGFRAGIASPFYFFDLPANKSTGLTLHPVTLMDVTYRDYLRLTPTETMEHMHQLIGRVREVNGELVTIWHNENIGPRQPQGWEFVYPQMVGMAVK